jgi:paraquat-inducible protein A
MVSVLVFITTLLIPAIELATMIYLLLPLSLGSVPPGIAGIMRIMHVIKPWGMVEVFMLGILVSLVKLKDSSTIIPGVALWSFGALTLLFAVMAASFNPRDIWEHLDPAPVDREAAWVEREERE